MIVLAVYVALFVVAGLSVRFARRHRQRHDLAALKTVTFGDESAIRPDRAASVISVLAIFLIWGAFTGSRLVPFHVPGPFIGEMSFRYTATDEQGVSDEATVHVLVHGPGEKPAAPGVPPGDGLARDDSAVVQAWRSVLIRAVDNDGAGARVTAINGRAVTPDVAMAIEGGHVLV